MLTNIEYEITPIEEADDAIIDAVKKYFIGDSQEIFVEPQIEADIANYLNVLKEGLYCIIEYPYIDKVYRDSYYNYFSSKHKTYQRDCIRVSLFSSKVVSENFLDTRKHNDIKNKYLGFFILRPTLNSLFGRSVISPEAFVENNFKICSTKFNNLIFGVKVEVDGFPHSSQDNETIKCAETTIWGIMEYFSNRYAEYKPTLPSKIIRVLERITYQRQLPSNGLTMDQISFTLKEFGFGTRIYSSDPYDSAINNIIDCYIESGIPILIGLDIEGQNSGHVIIGIGKRHEKLDLRVIQKKSYMFDDKEVSYYDSTDFPAKYVIQDDNLEPYSLIKLDNPGEHYKDVDLQQYYIDSLVVPLYPKVYLEAVIARELLIQVIKDRKYGYKFQDGFIFRYFLASSRSFKSHISNLGKMDIGLKSSILLSKMPKFIWCGEFYSKNEYKKQGKASGIVILDATEANQTSIDALIFAGYPDRCISIFENNFATLHYNFKNYIYYNNIK